MTKSQKAFRNVFFSTGTYVIQLLLSLIVRVYFVRYVGREYLGLNSVYASVLSAMSIADLGLDTVFIYLLYRPLKEENFPVIKGILGLYKNIYRGIALLITIIGAVLVPFIPNIIGKQVRLNGVYIIFVLYVINAVVGYLNAYNRSLFIADQNSYVVSGLTSGFIVLVNIVQIFQIIVYPSSVVYMIIQVSGTILTNVLINWLAKKKYKKVFLARAEKINKEEKQTLIHNGIGGVSNKLGSIVVVSSDNILLSIFTNLVTVGMYSNYTILTAAINKIMQTVSSAITPSLGQMGVEGNAKKNEQIFLELSFIIYSLALFAFFCFYGLVTPFVTLWLGEKNIFNSLLTWLISFNLWLSLIRVPSWMFADSFGLQWVQKWKAVYESLVNLGLSLIFLVIFHLSIEGIILGTICSTILTVIWYEPWTVFQHIIPSLNLRKYFIFNLPFILLMILGTILISKEMYIVQFGDSIVETIMESTIIIVILAIIYGVVFRNNKYFQKMIRRIKSLIFRKE